MFCILIACLLSQVLPHLILYFVHPSDTAFALYWFFNFYDSEPRSLLVIGAATCCPRRFVDLFNFYSLGGKGGKIKVEDGRRVLIRIFNDLFGGREISTRRSPEWHWGPVSMGTPHSVLNSGVRKLKTFWSARWRNPYCVRCGLHNWLFAFVYSINFYRSWERRSF